MSKGTLKFKPVKASLIDLVGKSYIDAVCSARAWVTGQEERELKKETSQKVDFYPKAFEKRLLQMLDSTGMTVTGAFCDSCSGATTRKFQEATKCARSPLTGYGYFRIGEDGRVCLTTKSEHYHTPLGHCFPGYEILDRARALGIPNATHNNTRGHITRVLEQELVRTANRIPGDGVETTVNSKSKKVLNRVLNLETGSLAVEAGLKMMLARFYRPEKEYPQPKYSGKTPVFLVMGNNEGGIQANYHGTTVITQTMRGMWPEFFDSCDQNCLYEVVPIRPNRIEDLDVAFAKYEEGKFKIAGFFHEIVMMNYGGTLLTKKFLRHAYKLCAKNDVPTLADEIQSCLWAPSLFLFHEYGITPTFVAIGKGFPGGEYPASRIVFNAEMDSLPQFGALVTNGQEEIASLAYLVTMRWAEANGEVTRAIGEYFESRLREIAKKRKRLINGVEGRGHLSALSFEDVKIAKRFATTLNEQGMDISVQTYKEECPPAALLKLPLIMNQEAVDFVLDRIEGALGRA